MVKSSGAATALVVAIAAFGSASRPSADGTPTRLLRIADRQRDADRVRVRATTSGSSIAPAARRGGSRAFRGRPRIRTSRPTASGSRSAASTPATSTSTSSPAEGGEPKRLTWHPGADAVQGWTPDGKSIVFASSRATCGADRRAALLDRARRRRRRGADAAAARVSGQDLPRRHAHRLPHEQLVGRGAPQLSRRPEPADLDRRSRRRATSSRRRGRTRRTWIRSGSATRVYFLSDRDGVANVWSYDTKTKKLAQVTKFTRLRRQDARRRAPARSCSSRPATSTSSIPKIGQASTSSRSRRRRFPVDDAAVEGRHRAG